MKRMIKIDQSKCIGCELCVSACHENVIGIVDGKATLLRQNHCDGLGRCLPVCPVQAISFTASQDTQAIPLDVLDREETLDQGGDDLQENSSAFTHLTHWPVQIKLVLAQAPFFRGAHLLVAADCAAYACGDFHDRFMKDKITVIGCPKLDSEDYSQKLTEIFKANDIKSVSVARMEVPCCSGIESAVKNALENCGKTIPLHVATISTKGRLV